MDWQWLLAAGDGFLIAPYRWPEDQVLGWWLGTLVLCFWCVILGEATMGLGLRANARHARGISEEMLRCHELSMEALKEGEKGVYKAANKMANEAFGKAFFLQMAMGGASLWPVFLGAAWLEARFGGLTIPFPLLGFRVHWLAGYLACYILTKIIFRPLGERLPFFRRKTELLALLRARKGPSPGGREQAGQGPK